MLKKLIKYEFRCTARYLGIIFPVFIVYALLYRGSMQLMIINGSPIFAVIFAGMSIGYMFMLYALIYVPFFYSVFRFYKNLVTDEGYLMHTLPVTPNQLVMSKLIVAMTWTTASVICIAGSVCLILAGNSLGESELPQELNISRYVIIPVILGILLLIVALASSFLQIYYSIAIGQTKNSNRALWSIVIYIGINFAVSIISTVAVIVPVILASGFNDPVIVISLILVVMLLVFTVISAGMYILTCNIFRKRLNLL